MGSTTQKTQLQKDLMSWKTKLKKLSKIQPKEKRDRKSEIQLKIHRRQHKKTIFKTLKENIQAVPIIQICGQDKKYSQYSRSQKNDHTNTHIEEVFWKKYLEERKTSKRCCTIYIR